MSEREDVLAMVDEYVHDLLPEADREFVAGRIAESRVWAAAHEEAVRRRDLLRAAPASEPGESLIASTMARVREEGPRRERVRRLVVWGPLAAVAALVLLFVGVNAHFANLRPSPYNLEVLGQASLLSGSEASIRVRLTREGKPVAGAPVHITIAHRPGSGVFELATFETDAAGTGSPRLTLPDWKDGEYELHVSARDGGNVERIVRDVTLRRERRVLLSTDKPVYQPGQTIRMRAFALKQASGRPVAGEEAVFEVSDAKGNLVFRENTVTSEFGIAWADCALADLVNEGVYSVRCRVGAESGAGAGGTESLLSVEVKRYVLPKFRVAAELDEPFYAPGDVVRGSVRAEYFFGKPVEGEVEVALAVEGGVGGEETFARAALDAEGKGEFTIRVPERLAGVEKGEAAVRLAVRVRDAAGQEVVEEVRRVVTNRALRIEAVPESGRLVKGMDNEVFVFVTSADGRPVDARVSVEGLARDLKTGELGVASFTLRPLEDVVRLAVRATDARGRTTGGEFALSVDGAAGAFVLRTDAASYDAGGAVRVSVFGGGNEPVFLDVIRGGQTVLTKRVDVADGRGEVKLDLPIEVTGAVRLAAYRFDERGWMVRRGRTIVVRPGSELDVSIASEPEYRPGETASLTVAVTGRDGRPAPGAVSLAIVDEAVFGVAMGGFGEGFRSLDSELMEPVYAVYPWDPFATGEGEEWARLERGVGALSARAEAGDRAAVLEMLVDEGYIGEDMLEVLESERLEQHLSMLGDSMSPETLAILRGDTGYSLREASYPEKAREVERAKGMWRGTRNAILVVAGILAGVGLVTGFFVLVGRMMGGNALAAILLVIVVVIFLVFAMLPTLGKARASARQMKEATSLRGIGQAIDVAMAQGAIPSQNEAAGASVRVREWFPETLLWRPQLVTDDRGMVRVEVPLADSITSWRVSGGAITADGRVGPVDGSIRVFQPFFVDVDAPVALVRGDEVELPVVVYSYLDSVQTVTLSVAEAAWFELLGARDAEVVLGAGEVKKVGFRIRAREIGEGEFEVRAVGRAEGASGREASEDAIRRTITVDPEGELVERVANGVLDEAAEARVEFPSGAVDGSVRAILKLYPSGFSQVLEGLDGIFRRPSGCFEQTSSTTYPNILALDYLRRTGVSAPEVEARARQYIHLGYQRLVSFEVDGGGFDWFGRPPANRVLTAYGLMEFEDMARVRDVDPKLIARTRAWLLGEQGADGSWAPESHEMHDGPASRDPARARQMTTAYIAWAVFRSAGADSEPARRAARYLESSGPVDDPYTLALVALALKATGGRDGAALGELVEMHRTTADGKRAWWERPAGSRSAFYGAGESGDIEATALAALALMEAGREPGVVRGALAWLADHRDGFGTWGTTQATVLALKAMVAGADRPLSDGRRREVEVRRDGAVVRRIVVEPGQSDVVQMVDLTEFAGGRVTLADVSRSGTAYQVALRHHEVGVGDGMEGPLSITVEYSDLRPRVGEWLDVRAVVKNATAETMPMVVLDLPIPAGFEADGFEDEVAAGRIAKFEVAARSVIVYLRSVTPGAPVEVGYRVRATMPVSVEVPGASAAEYYKPEVRGVAAGARVEAG